MHYLHAYVINVREREKEESREKKKKIGQNAKIYINGWNHALIMRIQYLIQSLCQMTQPSFTERYENAVVVASNYVSHSLPNRRC
jgi:hypothetical protein